ncbi:hypothetical protein BDEG_25142 [Batrachochytrium dendrobatidis JEL423]|uniref:Protein kintoun n=1 Tax=Batrachochytrium dendrobatidis (strain JEL423) TaxID=403673 RepID=A0A177WN72_BATDL|nr:hypothetical protein BDEG_25142 [Batrachochytrium dendrobatidis JEL423]
MTNTKADDGNKVTMTADELKRFQESFKDKEFRTLFFDYMNELSDPKNREIYEHELSMLESEKGNDVRYVKPIGVYVIKTATDTFESPVKVFINMCSSVEIEAAAQSTSKSFSKPGGKHWNIPYSLASPRDDVDNAKKPCQVYDCVFHPDTLKMGSSYPAFSRLLESTAIEGIEKQFNVKLKRDYKQIQMKCKGTPAMTMIRTKRDSPARSNVETSIEFIEKIQKQKKSMAEKNTIDTKQIPVANVQIGPKVPEYTIVHQQLFDDYQKFTSEREKHNGARPDKIVIRISLPGIASASEADLDVDPMTLNLVVSEKYKLHIDLPFPVFNEKGDAKFDKSKSDLVITLPVVPAPCKLADHEDITFVKQEDEPIESLVEDISATNTNPLISVLGSETVASLLPKKTDSDEIENQPMELAAEVSSQLASESNESVQNISSQKDVSALVEQFTDQLKITQSKSQIPPFHITQSAMHTTIVVDVANIAQDSLDIFIEAEETSIGFRDASGVEWKLHLKFESQIDTARIQPFDISDSNGVLVVYKTTSQLWNKITVVHQDGSSTVQILNTIENTYSMDEDPDLVVDAGKQDNAHTVTAHRVNGNVVVDIMPKKDILAALSTTGIEVEQNTVADAKPIAAPTTLPCDSTSTHIPVKLINTCLYDLD